MKKLETLCFKQAMALGQISQSTKSEDLPISLIKIDYDGEDMIFDIESRSRSVKFKFKSDVPIPLDHRLVDGCLGDIDSNTKLGLTVILNDNFVVVEISAEESKWKWSLTFQIMLVFLCNLGYH